VLWKRFTTDIRHPAFGLGECAVEQTNRAEIAESGLYTVPMAARLLAAKPEKVRSWVEGCGHSKADHILIRQFVHSERMIDAMPVAQLECNFSDGLRAIADLAKVTNKCAFNQVEESEHRLKLCSTLIKLREVSAKPPRSLVFPRLTSLLQSVLNKN
jgi:hypothetical protein